MPPFEAAVKRAKTWAVMTSYNRLNGTYVSERSDIVNGVLKREWGFDGLVMSDWSGTKSTAEAMNGGLDLEMPGPARYRGEKLLEAYRDGKVSAHALREASLRLLRLIDRVGAFDDPVIPPERADDRPEVRALIRRAGAEGVVLLKNNGVLPLAPEAGSTIAVIGPNAATAQIMGGGSAQINPHYRVTPLDALRDAVPAGVSVGLRTRRRQSAHRRALRRRGRSRIFRRQGFRRSRPSTVRRPARASSCSSATRRPAFRR